MIENEDINKLIHATFVAMGENVPMDKNYEYIQDVSLIDKE